MSTDRIPPRQPWQGWELDDLPPRTLPAQPPGWVDPDPLYVAPESIEPDVYIVTRPRPIPHRFAWFGLGVCVGVILLALVITFGRAIDAAPSSGQATAPVDVSGISSPALSGAPLAGLSSPVPPTVTPVPSPSGEVGTALIGGWATYWGTCADCAAAGPLLQEALGQRWLGQTVTVVSERGSVDLRLVTSCACGDRKGMPTFIDISVEAFDRLSPYPAGSARDPGVIAVSIEIGGPATTLPPTDPTPHPDDERMRLEVRDDELYR